MKKNITFLNLWEKSSHLNIGLLYVSSYAKKYSDNIGKVTYLDMEKFSIQDLKKTKPDIVGFTSVTSNFTKAKEAANVIKKELDIPIFCGGPHITMLPQSLPEFIDIGFMGEGEETFVELLNKDFQNLESIKGIVYHKNGQKKVNEPRPFIQDLDLIPFPDRDIVDMESYLGPHDILVIHEKLRGTNITTSRGCPFKCGFCQSHALWKGIRFFSPKYVADEIQMLKEKYKVEALSINDDLFMCNKKRIKEIVDNLEERGLLGEIKYNCTGRAELMDDEAMLLLKKMGVVQINYGVESGSERMLHYLKQGMVKVEDNQRAIDLSHKYGIQVYCNFILGNPSETKEDMLKTFDFYKRNKIETATLNICTPLPGTEIWEWAKKRGLVNDNMDWETFFNSLYEPETQLYINDIVPHKDFLKIYKEFQQEIFKNTALDWKGLTIKDALRTAYRQPRKSFKFLLKNYKHIPKILWKKN